MKEMLLVGRGGDGVVLASQILAETFARAGFWVQSFPEFKAERRGAPISAFLRWDEHAPIHRRFKVRECDVLVVVSPSPPSPELTDTVKPGGLIVLNRETRFAHTGGFDVARVPAAQIALEHDILSSDGRPMGNVAVLGACVRLLVPEGLRFLEEAVAARMSGTRAAANVLAAADGYARCTKQHALADDTPVDAAPHAHRRRRPPPLFATSTTDSSSNHTGTWSLERPLVHEACTACGVCALFCPEGAISKSDGSIIVDYLYCKGCGICEVVCPVRNALEMEEVPA
jgi:2-oxoacid:acceptor oxidoreductase gamma subunit (pyruvate/2-ketoisovalerate family)/2-oxoacid:acceptor oxidoreductase delta subunit (pyruvate/2-ketoisovalerate family)